ncbi:MAG: hypothetical protein D6761_02760 [Candidatus Dadabacteria bacterium]|nr:MAG: hypothetical protein D6761_02760 [Candidatus Dadabacteria bacterium]
MIAVNDAPVGGADSAQTAEDTAVWIDVLANDADPVEGDSVSIASAGSPAHGVASIAESGGKVGIRYTPNADYFGADSFIYQLSDTGGASATAVVAIEVTPVDGDPPQFSNLPTTIQCDAGEPLNFQATASDPDGPATITFAVDAVSGCDALQVASDGTLTDACPNSDGSCRQTIVAWSNGQSVTGNLQIAANTWFVRPVAVGLADGSSWDNATSSVQDAVDAAGNQDVFVSTGTWRTSGIEALVRPTTGVSIYGGFSPGEMSISGRATSALTATVFSGDSDDSGAASGGDAYHVVELDNDDVVMDGVRITGGAATVWTPAGDTTRGGAAIVRARGVVLRNMLLDKNMAANSGAGGGALSIEDGAELNIYDSRIEGNSAPGGSGGALYVLSGGVVALYDTVVSGNTSANGGAILSYGHTELVRSTLRNNTSTGSGNGGGAVSTWNGTVTATNSEFRDNQASNTSFGQGGAISLHQTADVTIRNSRFHGNTALTRGGAIFVQAGAPELTIIGSLFEGNSAVQAGGAIGCQSGDRPVRIASSDFRNNQAPTGGAGYMYGCDTVVVNSSFDGNQATGNGGALAGPVVVTNATFRANQASNGGGIYGSSDASVVNGTFQDNTASFSGEDVDGTVAISASCVQTNAGGSNVLTPPAAVSQVASGELFLDQMSLCVNQGNNAAADAAFVAPLADWRNGTTDLWANVLESAAPTTVDAGAQHDPADAWVIALTANATTVSWTLSPGASDCWIDNDANGDRITLTAFPSGSTNHSLSLGATMTLTCHGSAFDRYAEVVVTP